MVTEIPELITHEFNFGLYSKVQYHYSVKFVIAGLVRMANIRNLYCEQI
jgi:hypothetical protein